MKNKKPLQIAVASVGIVALVVVVAIAAFRFGAGKAPAPQATPVVGGRGVVAVPENVQEIQEKLNQPIEDGYYRIRMNNTWEFPSSKEASTNAYVENSTSNTRTVYFDLVLAETDELVYSSPFIPLGAKIEKFALDKELPAGEYAGTVTYHLVDDDYQEVTTVSVGVNLHIDK